MQGIATPGGAIVRGRSRRWRHRAAAPLAAAALLGGLAVASPTQAAPTAPVQDAGEEPVDGALTAQPVNTTYARQVLRSLRFGDPRSRGPAGADVPEADVVALGAALDAANTRTTLRTAALQVPQVRARVAELFEQLLDRPADPGGLTFWTNRVHAGTLTYEDLVITLTISNEAYTKAGANAAGYTDWVYQHVLGRAPDASGRAYWIGRLNAGTSRDRFARSFLRSTERSRALVRAGFLRYLGRPADAAGLQSWIDQYASGKVGEVDLAVALLNSGEARRFGCGHDSANCLLPFPSNRAAVGDPTTLTGWRVGFKPEWMPRNKDGKPINPVEWNRNDGFSVGQAALTRVPGIDLAQTGVAGLDDIGASLDADAPIVLLDLTTGERHPYFAELDANTTVAAEKTLYVRPAVNFDAGHTYAVALRNLKDAGGGAIAQNARFAADLARLDAVEEPEQLDSWEVDLSFGLAGLADAGVAIDATLHQAWTFTVASELNTMGRSMHIRDDALATLGDGAPSFTVGPITPNPRAGVAKRIEGTFQVPLYLTGNGEPGAGFRTGPDGLPMRNGTYTANYDCEIPTTASTAPARATVYGHGLFGGLGEVRSGPQAAMVTGYNMVYCATDWIGMANPDIANAFTILNDMSTFNTLPDRSQQGILNTIFLGRLLRNDAGFVSHAAFQNAEGDPLIDTSDLFYDGNSQGAVIGGAYLALSPDTSAGVLGVAGMNYATLLERSVDFDPFNQILKTTYLGTLDRVVGLQLLQMLWDRGETNGYAAYLGTERIPGSSPEARVLIHTALGDHQVATLTAEVQARTARIPVHQPYLAEGRTAEASNAWGLPAIEYGVDGSGLIIWDSGADLSPSANIPPRTGEDPHSDPRNSAQSQAQKSQFLRTGGTLIDVCSAAPCTAPAT